MIGVSAFAKVQKLQDPSDSTPEDAELVSGVLETPNGGSLRPKFGALEAEPLQRSGVVAFV